MLYVFFNYVYWCLLGNQSADFISMPSYNPLHSWKLEKPYPILFWVSRSARVFFFFPCLSNVTISSSGEEIHTKLLMRCDWPVGKAVLQPLRFNCNLAVILHRQCWRLEFEVRIFWDISPLDDGAPSAWWPMISIWNLWWQKESESLWLNGKLKYIWAKHCKVPVTFSRALL